MKSLRFSLAALAALAALTPFATLAAHAQKPALTENIDEKGRVPYHSTVSIVCPATQCTFVFRTVPAGYRLVVTHASAQYFGNPAPSPTANFAFLAGGTAAPGETPDGYVEYLPTPVTSGGGNEPFYVTSSPETYYVEQFGEPNIVVSNVFAGSLTGGTISGYLVSLP
jgi:hypothetical protein